MKRPWKVALFVPVPMLLLLLLSLSASAGTTAAGKAKPTKARTLVSEKGPIRSFAQDASAIAWIGSNYKVHVRSLVIGRSAIVGSARPPVGVYGVTPVLALAGTRALWTQFGGGNSPETSLWTSAFGGVPIQIDLFMGGSGDPGGIFLGGVAGDAATLLYGKTYEGCSPPPWPPAPCPNLEASGGVSFVTGQYEAPPISGIPAPVMLSFAAHDPQSGQISQGRLAVVPAASPVLTDLGNVPRAAENGPVQVYRFLNEVVLTSSVAPHGFVKAIALSFTQLAVLIQRANGSRLIERYDPRDGRLIGTTPVSSSTAFELGISNAGIVYRVGTKIYLVRGGISKLIWKAHGTPIGLSIEGRRIAWAENVKGHGRIVALTAPGRAQLVTSSGRAAAPKRNGDILYGGFRGKSGSRLLLLMRPDGTHQRRVGTARNVWSPAWSPRAKWIAYGATPGKGGLCPQLFVMRADGSATPRRLTHARNCYLNPTWAPGGKRIAFDVWGGTATAGIWTMNVDGSGLRLLTDKGNTPAWSPDGRTIAFRSKFPEAIWLMDADGSDLRQLTTPTDRPRAPDDSDAQPAWSFNGKWIAFSRQHPVSREWQRDIFIVHSDGGGLRQLTSHARQNTMPAWSSDGTRLAFVSDRAHRGLGDIYVMKADGTQQRRLTKNGVDNQWPDWGPRR
jgi:Tol biopolymer transport system component